MSRDIEDMQMQTFAAASALAASGRLLTHSRTQNTYG